MTTYSSLIAEKVSSKASVDDRHVRVFAHVAPIEVAPFEQRDAHGLKIAGRDSIHERLHIFAILGWMALYGRPAVPFITAQQRFGGNAGRFDARNATNVV